MVKLSLPASGHLPLLFEAQIARTVGQEGSGPLCAGHHWGFKNLPPLILGLGGEWFIIFPPKLQWKENTSASRFPFLPPMHCFLFLSRMVEWKLMGVLGNKGLWG